MAMFFVLDKIVWLDLIFFSFTIDNSFVGLIFLGLCVRVYYRIRSINFFMAFKKRKII